MSLVCPVCGHENERDSQYCSKCDATLEVAVKPAAINMEHEGRQVEKFKAAQPFSSKGPINDKNDDIELDRLDRVLGDAGSRPSDSASYNSMTSDYMVGKEDKELDRTTKTTIEGTKERTKDKTEDRTKDRTEKQDKKEDSKGHTTKNTTKKQRYDYNKGTSTEDMATRQNDYSQDEDESKSWIKLSYLLCPFCGELNKQSQFFCGSCGCDLKHAKSVKVPSGHIEAYRKKYFKPEKRSLIQVNNASADEDFRKFSAMAKNGALNADKWKLGRNLRLESSDMNLHKFIGFGVAIFYVIMKSVFRSSNALFLIVIAYMFYMVYKSQVKKEGSGEFVILSDTAVEVWDSVDRNEKKIREIKWDAIDQISIYGKDDDMRLVLESKDMRDACKMPVFSQKKRAMLLNTFGIIANRRGYTVYYDKDIS